MHSCEEVRSCRTILMLKAPIKGFVKTRLALEIGDERALEVYRWMGRKTLETVPKNWSIQVSYTPDSATSLMKNWLGEEMDFRPQGEGDLGIRMFRAYRSENNTTGLASVFLGGDCPALSSEILKEAERSLNEADVVIGPASDGGYYLIGMKKPYRSLFENMPWGEDSVLEKTLQGAGSEGVSTKLLPELADVDDLESLISQRIYFDQDLLRRLKLL